MLFLKCKIIKTWVVNFAAYERTGIAAKQKAGSILASPWCGDDNSLVWG